MKLFISLFHLIFIYVFATTIMHAIHRQLIRLKYVLFDKKLNVFQGLRQRSTSEAQELSADIMYLH